jgi:hypothetical protein
MQRYGFGNAVLEASLVTEYGLHRILLARFPYEHRQRHKYGRGNALTAETTFMFRVIFGHTGIKIGPAGFEPATS